MRIWRCRHPAALRSALRQQFSRQAGFYQSGVSRQTRAERWQVTSPSSGSPPAASCATRPACPQAQNTIAEGQHACVQVCGAEGRGEKGRECPRSTTVTASRR